MPSRSWRNAHAEVATRGRGHARVRAPDHDAIARGAARVRAGTDERTLTGAFTADCMAPGAQRVPFAPIIKSGPNSLWPWRILGAHYDRRNRTLHDGELVIFDVGCERDHYVSDVGRTFPVGTRFTTRQRELVEMVRSVSDAVIAAADLESPSRNCNGWPMARSPPRRGHTCRLRSTSAITSDSTPATLRSPTHRSPPA